MIELRLLKCVIQDLAENDNISSEEKNATLYGRVVKLEGRVNLNNPATPKARIWNGKSETGNRLPISKNIQLITNL